MSVIIRQEAINAMRLYDPEDCGRDGYPPEWHKIDNKTPGVKFVVREMAGHRCERCGHPYPPDARERYPRGEWTPCDEQCVHKGPIRQVLSPTLNGVEPTAFIDSPEAAREAGVYVRHGFRVIAQWRILTVHHLDGNKWNLLWWNLAALCQRCHLIVQGKVRMQQTYPFEHSDWFKPHAAGFYAFTYLGEQLTREQTMERLDELLALERVA